jgi:hypothetical protein
METASIIAVLPPIVITVALALFGISYYYFTTRYKERLALIEKGLSPMTFAQPIGYLPMILLLGILSMGIAAGIAVGAVLSALPLPGSPQYAYPVAIFFFLGLSLVVAYYILKASAPNK